MTISTVDVEVIRSHLQVKTAMSLPKGCNDNRRLSDMKATMYVIQKSLRKMRNITWFLEQGMSKVWV